MPQFDKITFFNQLFWLLFFFSGFYLLLLYYFLPKLSSILKARQKMFKLFLSGVSAMFNERANIQMSLHNECSFLLVNKNSNVFLTGVSFLMETIKVNLFRTFNKTLKSGLNISEKRLYSQTSFFLILLNLNISNDFFFDI